MMTKEEFLKNFTVDSKCFDRYVKYGIIEQTDCISKTMIDDISLALSMEKAGFTLENIKDYINMSYHQDRYIEELNIILKKQRYILLEKLHEMQKNVDMIDYLIYSLKNKEV